VLHQCSACTSTHETVLVVPQQHFPGVLGVPTQREAGNVHSMLTTSVVGVHSHLQGHLVMCQRQLLRTRGLRLGWFASNITNECSTFQHVPAVPQSPDQPMNPKLFCHTSTPQRRR
jgi:hypothetical protein